MNLKRKESKEVLWAEDQIIQFLLLWKELNN